jgi:hypothetical protein
VGERQQLVQTNLDRRPGRGPEWAREVRSWPRRRIAAAVVVVLLVLVLAVSCLGGADGRADVPVMSDGANAGVTAVRAPSGATGGTLRVVAADVDSLDPQRSYDPGVWNLMRLYTRTLVTYSTKPGATEELVPDLATDLGTTDDGGRTWTVRAAPGAAAEVTRATVPALTLVDTLVTVTTVPARAGAPVHRYASADGGATWSAAELAPADPAHPFAWRAWSFPWTAEPGTYELLARAADVEGAQPTEQVWNRQGMANNLVQRVPVTVLE